MVKTDHPRKLNPAKISRYTVYIIHTMLKSLRCLDRSQDLVDDNKKKNDNRTNYFTPCTHMWGNKPKLAWNSPTIWINSQVSHHTSCETGNTEWTHNRAINVDYGTHYLWKNIHTLNKINAL